MRNLRIFLGMAFILASLSLGAFVATVAQADTDQEDACWGQATQVFAKMDAMEGEASALGEHSSSFDNPRLGLANLAKAIFANLYD